jgi:hypothetical protein
MAHVAADSIRKFDEWKLHGKSQYLIWQLVDSEISIVKEAESAVDWDSFAKELLQREEPCWVTYNFQYKTKEGGQRSKLTYITWIPKTTSLKGTFIEFASFELNHFRQDAIRNVEWSIKDSSHRNSLQSSGE